MRVPTRILTTSRASLRHGTLRRLSSSIAGRQRHNGLSAACSSPNLFPFSLFFSSGVDPLCYNIPGCYHLSVVLCCIIAFIHMSNVPVTHCSFPPLLCSFMYTHSLVFISFYLSLRSHRTARCSPHLVLGSIITSQSVYRPLYSRLPLPRTCNLHAYTYIASYSSSSLKSYLIMTSHIANIFVLEVETLIEIGLKMRLHAWRKKRLVFGARGDHVACACGKMRSRCSTTTQLRNSETYGRAFRRSRAH